MARLSQHAPQWSQRGNAYRAQSRGQDGSGHIMTQGGGVPGRIQGLSALQQIAAMNAFRARTTLPDRANPNDAVKGIQKDKRRRDATEAQDTALHGSQEAARRRRRQNLIDGGLQPGEADRAVAQEMPVTAPVPVAQPLQPPAAVGAVAAAPVQPTVAPTPVVPVAKPQPTAQNSPALRMALEKAAAGPRYGIPRSTGGQGMWSTMKGTAGGVAASASKAAPARPADYPTWGDGSPKHIAQHNANNAVREKYRAGDAEFASKATPGQRSQVDAATNEMLGREVPPAMSRIRANAKRLGLSRR